MPVRVVADVDVLREEKLLREVVESLGGDWGSFSADWSATKKAIEERKTWYRAGDLRSKIDDVLGSIGKEAVVEKDTLNEITRLGRQTSPWEEVKRNGLPGPLNGEPAVRANSLLEKLRTIGLFVVPVGELENFAKTVGGHGPRWVEGALAKDLATDPELASAREFVSGLLASFSKSSPQTSGVETPSHDGMPGQEAAPSEQPASGPTSTLALADSSAPSSKAVT